MNVKTSLTLAVVAIAIGIYFLIFETDLFNMKTPSTRKVEKQQEKEAGTPLFASAEFSTSDVSEIRIERPEKPTVVIKRTDGGWEQVKPVRFPMDSTAVKKIPDQFTSLRYSQRITKKQDDLSLSALGLKKPKATVTVKGETTSDGESKSFDYTVELGKKAAAGGRAYLQKPDDTAAYVVGTDLHDRVLDKPITDMRKTSLPDVEFGSARKVSLQRAEKKSVQLVKQNARWTLTEPVTGRASSEKTKSVVEVINTAQIEKFVADQPADLSTYGLKKPRLTLKVKVAKGSSGDGQGGDGSKKSDSGSGKSGDGSKKSGQGSKKKGEEKKTETHRLAIGSPSSLKSEDRNYFAMWDGRPVVFTISGSKVKDLKKPVDELRDPNLTPVARSDIEDVLLVRQGQDKLHVKQNDKATWVFGKPKPGFALESDQVSSLLDAILKTKAEDYLVDHTIEKPAVTAKLSVVGQPQKEVLKVAERKGGKLVVVRGTESTGYVVERSSLDPLFASRLAYRERTILDIAKKELKAIKLKRTGKYPANYTIARKKNKSGEDGGSGGDGSSDSGDKSKKKGKDLPGWDFSGLAKEAVNKVIDGVTPLEAETWVSGKKEISGENKAVLSLTKADGSSEKVVVALDSRLSGAEGEDMLFKAKQDLVDAVSAELRERTVLDVETGDIASVKMGDLTVERDDDGNYSLAGDGELDKDQAGTLYDTLAGLEVDHYVSGDRVSGDPSTTLAIKTSKGKKHTLKLWVPEKGKPVGKLGDKTFTLAEDTAKDLTTEPTK